MNTKAQSTKNIKFLFVSKVKLLILFQTFDYFSDLVQINNAEKF